MKEIKDIIPEFMQVNEKMAKRSYSPMHYVLKFETDGLAPCVDKAHKAVQWWLNDIIHKENCRKRWVTLFGKSGCGKSHLTYAARNTLRPIFGERFAQRFTYGNLLDVILSGEYPDIMAQVINAPVLLLDDIGSELIQTEKAQSVAMKILYKILDNRLDKWTFLTSNLRPDQLPDTRITSRLFRGQNIVIDMSGADDYMFIKYKQKEKIL